MRKNKTTLMISSVYLKKSSCKKCKGVMNINRNRNFPNQILLCRKEKMKLINYKNSQLHQKSSQFLKFRLKLECEKKFLALKEVYLRHRDEML